MKAFRFTLVAVLAVLSVACSSTAEELPPSKTVPSSTTTTTTEPDATDFTAELQVAVPSPVASFDPHAPENASMPLVLDLVYDRLVHVEKDGSFVPGLAESWDVDGNVLQFNLRKNVRFHDGTPVDAYATQISLERATNVPGHPEGMLLEGVQEILVVDAYTVNVTVEGDPSAYVQLFSGPVGALVSPGALQNPEKLKMNPVGAGRFTLPSVTDLSVLKFSAFGDYWNEVAVPVSGITVTAVPDATQRALQFEEQVFDYVQFRADERPVLTGTVTEVLTERFVHIQFNRARSFFGDVRVRQAVTATLDKSALVPAYGNGIVVANGPFPEGHVLAAPDPSTDWNPKTLLAEAGRGEGFGFELLHPDTANMTAVAVAVQQQLASQNITVTLTPVPAANINQVFYGEQKGDAALLFYNQTGKPLETVRDLYLSGEGSLNPGNHEIAGLRSMMTEVSETVQPEPLIRSLRSAVDTIVNQAAEVWLFHETVPVMVNENVQGHDPVIFEYEELRGAGKKG